MQVAGIPKAGVGEGLPDEFLERLRRIVPPEALSDVLSSFSASKCVGLRVNTLKASRETAVDALRASGIPLQPVDWLPEAYLSPAESRAALVRHPLVEQGAVYIQNLSSMLAVVVLDPRPGEHILDLAAAPGGKTLLIAARIAGRGTIAAVEPVRSRYFKLRANLERGGAAWVKTYQTDGRGVGRRTGERFDRVLLDAPCSSEGRFHVDRPESLRTWSSRKIREQARKQVGLLRSALYALRPGGTLVYATCSMAPEENECVVDRQREWFGDAIRIEPIELPIPNQMPGLVEWSEQAFSDELQNARRILPNTEMDAMFLCKIRKLSATPHPTAATRRPRRRHSR